MNDDFFDDDDDRLDNYHISDLSICDERGFHCDCYYEDGECCDCDEWNDIEDEDY